MVDLTIFSRVDYWSLASALLELDRDGIPLGHGTGFFHMWGDQTYLVTAWHVLSGRHFQTGQSLDPNGAWPSHVTIWWNPKGSPGGRKTAERLPLWRDDNEPRWVELKRAAEWIDVAILPVNVPDWAEAYPVNELPEDLTTHGMGGDLFVLGFPLQDQPLKLPIWKRASLASEPELPEALQPYWLVDTASRSGMSGAPVIRRVYASENSWQDSMRRITNPGHRGVTNFVGVYSGRLTGRAKEDAQLGLVWPIQWISRLITEHLGQEAYEAGLAVEPDRRMRVIAAYRDALEHGGRAKP